MSNLLLHVASRAFNRPLLLHPDKAMIIHDVLSGRIGTEAFVDRPEVEGNRLTGEKLVGASGGLAYTIQNGVAIVPIIGSLVNRGAYVGASSGVVSYEGIEKSLEMAVADRDRTGPVVLDIDSPGGEATGMFALAERIRSIRDGGVRIIAVVNDMAASAAYGLAAQASEIWVSQTSVVGSIGVVMMHLDRSGEMAAKGIKPTFIYAGKNKVDGNSAGPLSEEAAANFTTDVGVFYTQFLNTVAAGRGERLTAEAARATEARVLIGEAAVAAGLADRIGTLSDLLSTANGPSTSAGSSKGVSMSNGNNTGAPAAATETGITQASLDAAVVAARAEGVAEGTQAGATAERQRIDGIVRHEAASGRQRQAMSLALDTDMSVDQAAKVLANSPAESALGLSQEAINGPEIGASALTPGGKPTADTTKSMIAASVARINARNGN